MLAKWRKTASSILLSVLNTNRFPVCKLCDVTDNACYVRDGKFESGIFNLIIFYTSRCSRDSEKHDVSVLRVSSFFMRSNKSNKWVFELSEQ